MCGEPGDRSSSQPFVWLGVVAAAVLVLWALSPYLARLWASLPGAAGDTDTTAIADQFGVTSSLFTALAFAALVVTIYQQQRGLAQQREELRSQREELALQREELKRSVEEMERSADAQAAQVRISSLAALLASLPALIQEEENRLVTLSGGDASVSFSSDNLGVATLEDLRTHAENLDRAATRRVEHEDKLRRDISKLEERTREEKSRQAAIREAVAKSLGRVPRAALPSSVSKGEEQLNGRSKALDKLLLSAEADSRLRPPLQRLIELRQELADAYEKMKAFQVWEGRKTGDSGHAAESDT